MNTATLNLDTAEALKFLPCTALAFQQFTVNLALERENPEQILANALRKLETIDLNEVKDSLRKENKDNEAWSTCVNWAEQDDTEYSQAKATLAGIFSKLKNVSSSEKKGSLDDFLSVYWTVLAAINFVDVTMLEQAVKTHSITWSYMSKRNKTFQLRFELFQVRLEFQPAFGKSGYLGFFELWTIPMLPSCRQVEKTYGDDVKKFDKSPEIDVKNARAFIFLFFGQFSGIWFNFCSLFIFTHNFWI